MSTLLKRNLSKQTVVQKDSPMREVSTDISSTKPFSNGTFCQMKIVYLLYPHWICKLCLFLHAYISWVFFSLEALPYWYWYNKVTHFHGQRISSFYCNEKFRKLRKAIKKKKTMKFWTLSKERVGSAPQPNFLLKKSMNMCIEGGFVGPWTIFHF